MSLATSITNAAVATDFLEKFRPRGPWTLTAIHPDKKSIETRTFRDPDAARGWLDEYNGNRNIYFGVNPLTHDVVKKASKEDVAALAWLHVDIDPRPGEDLVEERSRALALLTSKLPPDVPPPTCIVFSGGGYQGFWKLEAPIEINGNIKTAEELERYNRQLEALFGADHCHNVDRIMRLPGTLNIPDAKKRKKGRVAAIAELVAFDSNRIYSIKKFQAFEGPALLRREAGASLDSLNGNGLRRIMDIDSIDLPGRLTAIAVHGRNPEEGPKTKDDSRSAWLFDFVTNAIRAGVDDHTVLAIITDPEYKISASVLDKTKPTQYAAKQIAKARELSAANFRLSDTGNAKRLAHQFGTELRYQYASKHWFHWEGRRWAKDQVGAVRERAKSVVTSLYSEAAEVKDKDARKGLAGWAARSDSDPRIRAMIHLAQSEMPVLPEEFDRDRMLLNVENGTIDLRTGELRPHDRNDMITKLAPVIYDPVAKCRRWMAFLDEIQDGNKETIAALQRLSGYCLTGDTTERVFPILWGDGLNGKSTFIRTITTMLGDYAKEVSSEAVLEKQRGGAIPNDLAGLVGVRFAPIVETGEGRHLAEARVKSLTGNDIITARFLFGEWFSFAPEFKPLLATNHRPVIRGQDAAIWDRLALFPFTVRIPQEKVDRELPQKLNAELPGILAWAVRGCLEWQKIGGLKLPDPVRAATKDYQAEMDVLGAFLDERCTVHENAKVAAAALFTDYQDWATMSGERVISRRSFNERLRALPGVKEDKNIPTDGARKRGWSGIGLSQRGVEA